MVQRFDSEVAGVLGQASRSDPARDAAGDSGLGKPGLDDFLAFVLESSGERGLAGARVLEIGAGEGALLAAISAQGAIGIGVEPGADAVAVPGRAV